MQQDIWKFIFLLASAALLGFLVGYTLASMLLAALCIIAWQIHRLNILFKWVEKPKKNPLPETSGQFYLLHKEINRRRVSNSKRKKQVTKYLKQFRKAISAMPDAIILIDDDASIEWANGNASSLLGVHWPNDASIRLHNLIRNPDFIDLLNRRTKENKGLEIVSPIDNTVFVNIKCIRYTDDLRMIIARDVSRLLQINNMHSDFVANVSHELKTPLTVLRGYIEMLQAYPDLDSKLDKPISQMETQSLRMQLIVNDLLYLSKLEDKAYKAHKETINIAQLVASILESVQTLVDEKQHKIILNIDESLSLLGTSNEIHSAFSNLIQNSINYTPDKGEIEISWSKYKVDGGSAFTVSDNGIGIPKHHIPRLTERFYRTDDNRSRKKGGTGLGLAIVKHVLNRHGATLDIESTPGVGSQFICQFP